MAIPVARSSRLFLALALPLCGLSAPARVVGQETPAPETWAS